MSLDLVGSVGAIAVALGWGLKWGYRRWTASRAVESAILAEAKILDISKAVRRAARADRVTVFEAHNGGHIPAIGDTLYSTARWESRLRSIPSLVADWTNRRLDAGAINVLRHIVLLRTTVFRPEELDDGMVRDMYLAHGVQSGLAVALATRVTWWDVLLLRRPHRHWLWLCIDWTDQEEPDEAQRDAISQAAAQLTEVLYGRGWGRHGGGD